VSDHNPLREACRQAEEHLKILKKDNCPPIIGLCGDIGAGKDSAAAGLVEELGYARAAFANQLKETVAKAFPWIPPCHFFGTQEEKAMVLFVSEGQAWTGRKLLEVIGQHFRDLFPGVWVRAAMEHIDRSQESLNWAITDVRHPNEFEAIRKRGGVVWEVVKVGGPPAERTGHISDQAWRTVPRDATLVAEFGDLEGLKEAAVALALAGGRQ